MTLFTKVLILLTIIVGIILILIIKKKLDQWAIDRAMRPYIEAEKKDDKKERKL